MPSAPITSVYNDGYIAEVYEAYRRDPASVDESWRQFFRFAEQLGGVDKSTTTVAADPVYLRKVAGAAALVDAIRTYGHLAVQLDPLGSPPPGAAELTPEFHGITASDLQLVPALALGFDVGTGADVTERLRDLYSSTMGFDFAHLGEEAEREWFRETIEHERLARYLTPEEKRTVLRRLSEVDGLERFIGRAWVNMKRFSIEGTDALVPMLDVLIDDAARAGTREVVIAMAHRGRINVLTHILGKPYATVFGEFDGRHAAASAESETGDVKYHLGARTERTLADGQTVGVQLVPNPSHLEVVNPVVTGLARARQRVMLGERLTGEFDSATVTPVLVHGDAAFPGEGIVAESLNLSRLRGYTVGGSLHIIVNNQVGFTTDPTDARSTHYASDLAKGFEIPIVHVNADDLEACIAAVRLGVAYRTKFKKDFLIDLVGYRRHGHNEGDEPTFTQPTLYATIKAHPTPRQVWGERLVREGIVTTEDVQATERDIAKELEEIYDESKKVKTEEFEIEPSKAVPTVVETAVRAEQLVALNEQLLAWPTGFSAHPRLAKQLERRRDAMGEDGGIDWGHAESLAFASLLAEGASVRLSGQDAERGTFSHRHAVLHDPNTGQTFTPLQHLPNARGQFEIYNSPLSETGVLGFEYGYSTAADDSLVLWEAQFGDFVNVAQPIIDQFIAADRAKWAQDSGVVMLLPHGYEGQGPEHSSARLERFLQLCADGNLTVAYPSTAAQYFHILRRQAKSDSRRPLVLMQPKSLLRLPQAASRLEDLVNGRFASVIDDQTIGDRRDEVQRVVFCTGKLFYDLNAKERPANVAIARVEELYPWPAEQVSRVVDLYRNVTEVVWAQEEPKNMGAWSYVWPRLRACTGNAMLIRYVGRPERASPAEGYVASHQEEQARIVTDALEVPTRRKAAARS
jgi:2-oxoglutarate dehydrogenase E1 component